MEIEDVQHFVDCADHKIPFFLHWPVRLARGRTDHVEDVEFDPAEEADVSGFFAVEVVLGELHFEVEAVVGPHEEEESQDSVEHTSGVGCSVQQFQEGTLEGGAPNAFFDLDDGGLETGDVHDLLFDDAIGLQTGRCSQFLGGQYGAVRDQDVAVQLAGVFVVGPILYLEHVCSDVVRRRVHCVGWVDKGVQSVQLVVPTIFRVLAVGTSYLELQTLELETQLQVTAHQPDTIQRQAQPICIAPLSLLLGDVGDHRKMLVRAGLEGNVSPLYLSIGVTVGSTGFIVECAGCGVALVEHVIVVADGCHVGETGGSVLVGADVGHGGL